MADSAGQGDIERLVVASLADAVGGAAASPRGLYRHVIERVERPLLRHALEVSGGNQLRAARLLGINRNTLRKRLRSLGLLPGPAPRATALAPGPPGA